jgi:hypothetical protein
MIVIWLNWYYLKVLQPIGSAQVVDECFDYGYPEAFKGRLSLDPVIVGTFVLTVTSFSFSMHPFPTLVLNIDTIT